MERTRTVQVRRELEQEEVEAARTRIQESEETLRRELEQSR